MIQSAIGQFTIVDPQGLAQYFWKGAPVLDVLSASLISTHGVKRFAIRVINPEKVLPALSPEEITSRQAVHLELTQAGIIVNLTRGRDYV